MMSSMQLPAAAAILCDTSEHTALPTAVTAYMQLNRRTNKHTRKDAMHARTLQEHRLHIFFGPCVNTKPKFM